MQRILFTVLCVLSLSLGACGTKEAPAAPPLTKAQLQEQAAQGSAEAMFELGALYHDGGPHTDVDLAMAFEWFTQAASLGEERAQFNLGVMYYTGEYVEQDFQQAIEWFEKAANQGNARAQFNLGVMYYRGEGIEQNFDRAYTLFTNAALQGFNEAMFNLGVMHVQGQSVDIDTGVGYAWFAAAEKYGNPNARAVMMQIEDAATDEQREALEEVSEALIKQVDEAVENGGQLK